ncbi:MAG: hypothetical protein U0Q18_19955 [Bryobacteraceae bacterium]
MAPPVSNTVTTQVLALLGGRQGLNARIASLTQAGTLVLPLIGQNAIAAQNASIELSERSSDAKYPAVNVYCEKIANQLTEKFRTFSGTARMAVEIRVSQDRLSGIEDQMQQYVDMVAQVLDQSRGDWGQGMYYAGGYEASFGPVKHGGRNFIQTGKVTFEVGVSN